MTSTTQSDDAARTWRLCWLASDDRGGGVISVAQACCRQAVRAGYDTTLLLLQPPTGHASEFGGLRVESLQAQPPYADAPARFVNWLRQNPQDVVVLNACEQVDVAMPYVPQDVRLVYAVHNTESRYFDAALRHEEVLHAFVAVSETVAARFRHRLKDPSKLHVVLNGVVFPIGLEDAVAAPRADDLLFLGGDNPAKGAFDAMNLWSSLQAAGFGGRLHWFGWVGQEFRENIARLPGAERIEVHGRQPRQAVFEIAARSKVVLILSRSESFGMATVECMGMGCLPVAWDIATGTKEIIRSGEGVFESLGDYAALTRGVRKALALHPSRFVDTARRIRRDFGEETMWGRYEQFFSVLPALPRDHRSHAGQSPPAYRPPLRLFQLVPAGLRKKIRQTVGKSPRIGYALRDFRGW